MRALLLGLLLGIVPVGCGSTQVEQDPATAVGEFETRCGWFRNPTPANAWLDDGDGEWIIAMQGGHQAEGDWPEFDESQWVRTNVNYGYGCACLRARVDHETREVIEIESARALALSECR